VTNDDRPLILVTNDDGIASPGLRAAVEAVHDLGDLLIAAPRWQQTGAGRSMPASATGRIIETTLDVGSCSFRAYAIEGAPAQVVQHALLELAYRRPALLVAGINYGENLGSGVTVSGTIGAILEAASFGIKGLAVSLETHKFYHLTYSEEVDFTAAIHFTRFFARQLLQVPLPPDVDALKVDVPSTATPETPWRMTRISRQRYFMPLALRDRPREGVPPPLDNPAPLDYEPVVDPDRLEPDSDIYVFSVQRMVTVSPLSLDLTARTDLTTLASRFDTRHRPPPSRRSAGGEVSRSSGS